MTIQTRASRLDRDIRISHNRDYLWQDPDTRLLHKRRVMSELRSLGVKSIALHKSVARYLPKLIHEAEHIKGAVYGRNEDGYVMLVATDRRVIYVNKKLFFADEDEVGYNFVSGVQLKTRGIEETVTLHTRIKNYNVSTFNFHCAKGFVEYIESRCLERPGGS